MAADQDDELVRPTPERMAKAGSDISEMISDSGRLTYRMKDSPIDRLAFGKRPKIDADQYSAALRYYEDAYAAGMMPSCVIDVARPVVDGGQHKDLSDFKQAAQVRREHTIRALDYAHLMILDAIILQEVSLAEYAERFQNLATRRERQAAALITLHHGLNAAARHYNPGRSISRGIRSSMTDGDRPIIMPADKRTVSP